MSTASIVEAQKVLGRYGLSTLIIFGNIGNLFNILIFIRNLKNQLNSCTCYLLSSSIINWVLINTTLMSSLYGVYYTDPQHQSLIVCKLRWYGGQILLMLSRSFMIAACIDRWACTSARVRVRALICRPKTARWVILALFPIWILIPIHMAVHVTITAGRCGTPSYYAFAFGMYLLIFIGIIPPVLMITFGSMAFRNLKSIRSRVHPSTRSAQFTLQRGDRDLIKMLTGEVLVYLITTVVYPANVLYGVITRSFAEQKSPMRIAIENLSGFIISPLLNYVYCAAPFYVYMFCSKRFRTDFIRLFRRPTQNHNANAFTTDRSRQKHPSNTLETRQK